jgi:DNA polymerase I-like protein with 3'-5' exonuclease and polymerase domains
MNKFFEMMPKVSTWLNRQKLYALQNHEVSSIYGRKRRFPLIASQSHKAEVQRQAGNMPVQSSVSDMTLLANMRIIKVLEAEGIKCRIWPHVHDGFYFQVLEKYEERAVEVTKNEMHAVGFKTDVNFKCEIQTGTNWGKLKVVYDG